MSGRDSLRGYFLQAFVAVLHSIEDDDWETVLMEPEEYDDKVDVIWKDKNNNKMVTQVKSTINILSIQHVKKILIGLTHNVKDASEYNLIVIGDCDELTNVELGDIPELKFYSDKIKIQQKTFDYEALENDFYRKIHSIMSEKSPSISQYMVEMHMAKLIYEFKVSTFIKKEITRDNFIKLLELPIENLNNTDLNTLISFGIWQLERYFNNHKLNKRQKIKRTLERILVSLNLKRDEIIICNINRKSMLVQNGYIEFFEEENYNEIVRRKSDSDIWIIPSGAAFFPEYIEALKEHDFNNFEQLIYVIINR